MPVLIGAGVLAAAAILAVVTAAARNPIGASAASTQQAKEQGGGRGNTGADTVGRFLGTEPRGFDNDRNVGNDTRATGAVPFLSIFMPPPQATTPAASYAPITSSVPTPGGSFTPGVPIAPTTPDIQDLPMAHSIDSAFSPIMYPSEINPAAVP